MSEETDIVSRDVILSLTKPVVFHEMIRDWEVLKWSIEDWTAVFGDDRLPFRCGEKSCSLYPLWERDCSKEEMTLKEFAHLNRNPAELEDTGKWFYFDYKYIHEWVSVDKNILKSVNWSKFGFPEMGALESTIWIGSRGAHTPCHYDTYGCNLVAQVVGTKRWLLFPKDESENMKLTRIPYEESSVYSRWNFNCPLPPNFYPGCRKVYIVDLKPGDVLFVPRHWWHYVECLEPSISINAWIPTSQDDASRLDEALIRLTMSHMAKSVIESDKNIMLHPNEDSVCSIQMKNYTNIILHCITNVKGHNKEKPEDLEPPVKKLKPQISNDEPSSVLEMLDYVVDVPCSSSDVLRSITNQKCNCNSKERHQTLMSDKTVPLGTPGLLHERSETALHKIINAYCHPDVVSLVREKLTEGFNEF